MKFPDLALSSHETPATPRTGCFVLPEFLRLWLITTDFRYATALQNIAVFRITYWSPACCNTLPTRHARFVQQEASMATCS